MINKKDSSINKKSETNNNNSNDYNNDNNTLSNNYNNKSNDLNEALNSVIKLKKELNNLEIKYTIQKDIEQQKKLSDCKLKTSLNLVNCFNDKCSNYNDKSSSLINIKNHFEEWKLNSTQHFNIIEDSINDLSLSNKSNFLEKKHVYRESLITILFYKDKHLKSLYYFCVCLFFWMLCWVITEDYKNTGYLLDFSSICKSFSKFDITIYFLLFIYTYSLIVIIFIQAIKYYLKDKSHGYNFRYDLNKKIPYFYVFTIYIVYWSNLYIIVSNYIFIYNLPGPSAVIVGCELARVSLKIHGYFREKMLYGLKEYHPEHAYFKPKYIEKLFNIKPEFNKNNSNNEFSSSLNIPLISIDNLQLEFKRYIYYFFCPSLIYRDEYPRLKSIRWKYVYSHLLNFVFCFLSLYIIYRYSCEPFIVNYKVQDHYSLSQFIYDSLAMAFTGITFLMVGFFLILHTWLNLWAEILKHGDRKFYEDWWTCTNFEVYYRKWNMVVHEWLYYYVYNDIIRFSQEKLSKNIAKFFVFFLSVIVHEIVIFYFLGFFYPVLSFFFGGPGVIFTYIRTKDTRFNVLIWTKLLLGKGLIVALLLREFNARILFNNITLVSSTHKIIPRSILIYFSNYKDILNIV